MNADQRRALGWAAFVVGLALAAVNLVLLAVDIGEPIMRWSIGAAGVLLAVGGWEAAHGRRV